MHRSDGVQYHDQDCMTTRRAEHQPLTPIFKLATRSHAWGGTARDHQLYDMTASGSSPGTRAKWRFCPLGLVGRPRQGCMVGQDSPGPDGDSTRPSRPFFTL